MKILRSRDQQTKKLIFISLLVIAAISIAALIYIYAFHGTIFGWPNRKPAHSTINYESPTPEQIESGQSAKESFVSKYYSAPNDQKTANTDKIDPQEVGVLISSILQNSDTLQVRTTIQSTAVGKCKLTLTSDNQTPVTRDIDTQNLGSYSTCKGFDIPLTELKSGSWKVKIDYTNENMSGSASQDIEVKK